MILLVGALLRYYGIDWDYASGLHPDERFISGLVQGMAGPLSWSNWTTPGAPSPLNPPGFNFNYGSLSIYLYAIVGHVAAWLGSWVPGLGSWQDALGSGVLITGRAVSAASGVLTILVVYLIGVRLYNRAAGLLAAAFFAVCVLDIQLSHFLTVDTLTTCFATLAVYWYVRLAQQRRPLDFVLAGAATGAALACKVSVLPLLLPLAVAPFLPVAGRAAQDDGASLVEDEGSARADEGESRSRLVGSSAPRVEGWDRAWWLIVSGLALLAVFFATQPYALVDMNKYISDVAGQASLAAGQSHIFYTDKFYRTPPYWYHIEHIVPWDLGWPLGLVAMAGVIVAVWRSFARRQRGEALLVLWTLAYFLATGGQFMKYVRYMLPIMPMLCLFAAAPLLPMAATLRARSGEGRTTGTLLRAPLRIPRWRVALATGVLALTTLYALAYDNIYSTLNTRLAASLWIESHVRPGTPYTTEGNLDEGLPWGFANHPVPPGYNGTSIATQSGSDTLQTWTGGVSMGPPAPTSIAATLANAQYVTISSERIIGTVPHLPQAFPFAGRYYCLLFGAHPPAGFHCPRSASPDPLGFRLVKSFSNHPNLFGLTLDDYVADQNFSEYDHPPVWIFQRVRAVSPAATAALITDNGRVHDVAQVARPDKPLLLTPQEVAANNTGPSYAQEFPTNGLPMRLPALVWLLWVEALGLLALPLSLRLFRRLPDRGYVLAKTVGILLVAYLAWIAASLHVLRFTHLTILGAAVVVGAASLLWGVPLKEVRAFWREKSALVESAELVFVAGFVADVVVRMIYPDLWHGWNGGEKPMDVSYLNGMVRSQTMPPADSWFAGGYTNYYYYGYFVVATLIKLTGIAPNVAYNLAVPTLFGLVLASTYTLGYALTRRRGIALLAAALMALAGNLFIGAELIQFVAGLSPVQASVPLVGGIVQFVAGLWQLATHPQLFPGIGFRAGGWGSPTNFGWDSTRVIGQGATINEFPFFTFLYADLHAHMMDMPGMLACIALAVNAGLGARPWLSGARSEAGRALLPGAGLATALATAVIVGSTGPANTWDVVTALLLVALGVAVAAYAGGKGLWAALLGAAVAGAVLAVLALGLYYPFYSHLKSFYSALGFTLAHTALDQFLMVWGLFLFILTSYIAVDLWRGPVGLWLRQQARAGEFVLYYWPRRERVLRLLRVVAAQQRAAGRSLPVPHRSLAIMAVGAVLALVALGAGSQAVAVALLPATAVLHWGSDGPAAPAPVLALLLLLLGAFLAALLEDSPRVAGGDGSAAPLLDGRPRRITLMLALLALGITAACEVAYLADFYAGGNLYRTNTVFKLYEQAWPLFALSSAAALAGLLRPLRVALPAPALRPAPALGIVAAPVRSSPLARSGERAGVPERPATPHPLRRLWLAVLGLLLLAVALYPIFETPAHLAERPSSGYWIAAGNPPLGLTLDGTAFVQKAFPGEYAALTWLNDNVRGDPTVLSSDGGGYTSFGFRVPWMTGLPNVVEGNWEQAQQRYSGQTDTKDWPYAPYPDEVGQRHTDIQTMYSTSDTALALQLLHKYHVAYVYVGVAERGQASVPSIGGPPSGCFTYAAGAAMNPQPGCMGYPAAGLAKFARMAAAGTLKVVYNRAGVTIYQVMT